MDHLDDDLLGLLALGERPATEEELAHLESCGECGAMLSALRSTVFAATVNPEQVPLEAPGSHNWAAIHRTLGLSPALAEDPLLGPGVDIAGRSDAGTARTEEHVAPKPLNPGPKRPATPARQRRPPQIRKRGPRRPSWILGLAAGVAIGAAGAWTALTLLGPAVPPVAAPTPPPTAAVVAEATLAPLAGHSASGSAVVEKLPDGTRQLVVSLPEEKLTGFREVWVGSADLSKMVSLGVLGEGSGAFVIPGGVNLADYPVLDISNEPYDGNPAHSAESIARGKFTGPG
ncbi:anti-sigma factor [Arthrobacter sp. 2YAF22_2]|uniref:anti-sigma factor n=1 Tax=Arthrobacter sp. 2YAF22_2 TaxID=3233029 RepID=UPI003F91CA21